MIYKGDGAFTYQASLLGADSLRPLSCCFVVGLVG